jgi:hypothetical protein
MRQQRIQQSMNLKGQGQNSGDETSSGGTRFAAMLRNRGAVPGQKDPQVPRMNLPTDPLAGEQPPSPPSSKVSL